MEIILQTEEICLLIVVKDYHGVLAQSIFLTKLDAVVLSLGKQFPSFFRICIDLIVPFSIVVINFFELTAFVCYFIL